MMNPHDRVAAMESENRRLLEQNARLIAEHTQLTKTIERLTDAIVDAAVKLKEARACADRYAGQVSRLKDPKQREREVELCIAARQLFLHDGTLERLRSAVEEVWRIGGIA